MEFIYRNASGLETRRKIESHREDEFYIYGYCIFSKSHKTFRKDRVVIILNESNQSDYQHINPPEPEVKKAMTPSDQLTICFTGFRAADKTKYEEIATNKGLIVKNSVIKNLSFLCVGDNAGPSKIKKADDGGSYILTINELLEMLETGALPVAS